MMLAARLAIFLCLPIVLSAILSAQKVTVSQPTIWAAKPDVASFEKIETDVSPPASAPSTPCSPPKARAPLQTRSSPSTKPSTKTTPPDTLPASWSRSTPDVTFRDHATAMATKASAAQTAISLNHDVYNALAALDLSQADPPHATTSNASFSNSVSLVSIKTMPLAPASRS